MSANNSNSTLTTDFSIAPYHDDRDESKNFYRFMFRPGRAIQGRELNGIQSYTQKQIDRLGKHLFKEGSIVLPGQFTIENDLDYVKIKDIDTFSNQIDVSKFLNQEITGSSGIKAIVVEVADGVETDTNTKMLFIRYKSSATGNPAVQKFVNSEVLSSSVGTATALSSSAIGVGSRFVISSGVFFAKEHLISFNTQSVILDRTSTAPTCRVGFTIIEELVTHQSDMSLLDPALESSNYSAPGADRLKLSPILTVLDVNDQSGAPDFVELFTISNGIVTEQYERSQYNIVKDELAKRTFDESGDYYVNGLNIRVRENLDTGSNDGYSNTGNSQLLSIGVEPGLAYVKGYEVGKLVTTYVTTEKSTEYRNVNSQIVTVGYGNYIKTNEYTGSIKADEGTLIYLYDKKQNRLTNKGWSVASPTGNVIGTARVIATEYDSGSLGTPTGNVNIYLSDISMNGSNSFSNTRSVYVSGFGADIVLDASNVAVLRDTSTGALLSHVGVTGVKALRDSSGNPDMSFVFKRTSDVVVGVDGLFDISLSTGETFPYGVVGNLSDADARDFMLSFSADSNIALPGTITATANTTAVVGVGTQFTRFNAGDKIEIAGKANTFFIDTITDATHLNTKELMPVGVSGNAYFKVYKTGDIVDMTGKGVLAGTDRTIATTPSLISFDLKENYTSTIAAKATYQVARSGGHEVSKTLRDNRYVKISCATAGITGPFNLGIADVYKIRSITKKTGSAPASIGDGTSVTESFEFDNGQRDNMYDFATISPKITLGATDYLLVCLDYFEPSFSLGVGYFSVDSYPINDGVVANNSIRTENVPVYVSPSTKSSHDLRNYVDFRPVKLRSSADATTVGAATTNPARSSGFTFESNGLRLPVPSSQATFDYSFYLARKDVISIDKDGNIIITKGLSDTIPRTPLAPENSMVLGSVTITPYPSLSPKYAQGIRRMDLANSTKKLSNVRHTMRDIGVMKNRIANLEYYNTLNALEKSALDMQIVDENGLDRFKNGVFVDSFMDHSLGDLSNQDYRIIVDSKERSIRPVYTMNSLYYDYVSGSDIQKTGDLITLPYTDVELVSQNVATSIRNVELSSYRFVGNLYMNPDTDVWVDTEQLPDEELLIGPSANNMPQAFTEWEAWNTVVGEIPPPLSYNKFLWTTDNLAGVTVTGGARTQAYYQAYGGTDVETISSRTGLETYYTTTESTVELGNRVLDVSMVAYIKPQVIKINGKGLKANTRMHTFFDGENMSQYVSVLTKAQYDQTTPGITPSGTEGAQLVTDSNGEIYAALRLPANKKFRVGTKEVILTDSPTNSQADASSYARGYFVSQGLIQQKQGSVLTTREVVQQEREVAETVSSTKTYYYIFASCAAYSFLVKAPEGEEGVFLTKADLFFAAKHPTLGVWCEIREMDNSGGITRNQVPFSEVWIDAADLVVSDDATAAQEVKFKAPIFLYNNKQYAFVIHTVGINPDTYFWISRIGETNISTGQKHNARALAGTFYTTNNNLNWDMVADVDLKIKLYRASFQTGVVGQATIANKPYEKLMLGNVTAGFTNTGETVVGKYKLNLTGNTASIVVTDVLKGVTSGANSVVSNVISTIYTVANTSYLPGERVNVFYGSNLVSKGISSVISGIDSASGTVYNYKSIPTNYGEFDGASSASSVPVLEVRSSNGSFSIGDTITGVSSGATATVDAIRKMRYSTVDFEPSFITFVKTDVGFEMQTASNTNTLGSFTNVAPSENYAFEDEKAILSRSQEVALLVGSQSNKVRISMSTATEFLSPVVDLGRTHTVYVDNIINANTVGETSASGGRLTNKYISRPLTLEEGQDAEDIIVRVTAYRPPTTDVKVWIKIIHAEDSDTLATAGWIELEKSLDYAGNDTYSSLSNKNDFREYRYGIPASYLTGPNGEVQYTNSKGIKFTGYKYYAIKVGLLGSNSAVVPRAADLQGVNLQI